MSLRREQFLLGYELIDGRIVDDKDDIDLILQAPHQALECVTIRTVKDNNCGYQIASTTSGPGTNSIQSGLIVLAAAAKRRS